MATAIDLDPTAEDLAREAIDEERAETDGLEWGWLTITELVTGPDGPRGGWFHTERFLYYSPAEARERFAEMLADKGWRRVDA